MFVLKFEIVHFTTSWSVWNSAGWVANSVDPDQMQHSAASDLSLHCLLSLSVPIFRFITVRCFFFFSIKKCWYFSYFSTNKYVLVLIRSTLTQIRSILTRGTSNEYPQQLFLEKCEKYFPDTPSYLQLCLFLFVLRFYGPVNPMGSCRARSVYLTTRLLGRLSPLSG